MASISLQDLRRRLYDEAKADKTKRFWGLYVHVAKLETLRAAYDLAKRTTELPNSDDLTASSGPAPSLFPRARPESQGGLDDARPAQVQRAPGR
jgi:RNA-directed DNA polymerase